MCGQIDGHSRKTGKLLKLLTTTFRLQIYTYCVWIVVYYHLHTETTIFIYQVSGNVLQSKNGKVSYVTVCRDDNKETTAGPVFVHQSPWQLQMLRRYGSPVCLIDATYNTTVYGMPLFMLCVLTNSGYVVVGTFLCTDEQTASIAAGLRLFAERCPEWKPKYMMSDFSEAQISAAESVFPSKLYWIWQCVFELCLVTIAAL